MPIHGAGVETPPLANSLLSSNGNPPMSAFLGNNDRPFGAALGFGMPGETDSGDAHSDERLFTVKVERSMTVLGFAYVLSLVWRGCRLPRFSLRD